MKELREWVTMPAARELTGRSARTIRRWVRQNKVRKKITTDGDHLYETASLLRAEAKATAYKTRPTFGRV